MMIRTENRPISISINDDDPYLCGVNCPYLHLYYMTTTPTIAKICNPIVREIYYRNMAEQSIVYQCLFCGLFKMDFDSESNNGSHALFDEEETKKNRHIDCVDTFGTG